MSTEPPALSDGVYLGLPEDVYFAQDRIGSTDLVKLYGHGLGWWYGSRHNPNHKDQESKFRDRGHALHCWLLEGEEAFAERFATLPDRGDYPGLMDTIDEMKIALKEAGAPLPSNGRKKDLVTYCREYLSRRPIWDDVMDGFTADHPGKTFLSPETSRHLAIVVGAAQADDEIGGILKPSGPRMNELSVFWTRPDGTPLRFRFDALLPAMAIDVKGVDNSSDRPFPGAVAARMREYRLELQAALSYEARQAVYDHIVAGRIHGGSTADRKWLRRYVDGAPKVRDGALAWEWLWLFIQWPNDTAGRAAEILPVWSIFGDERHREGVRAYLHAIDTWQAGMKAFGPNRPWTRVHPIHGLRTGTHQINLAPDYNAPVRHPDEDALLSWT